MPAARSGHPRTPLQSLADRARLLAAADAGAGSSSAKLSGTGQTDAGELLWLMGIGDGLANRPADDLVALPLASLLTLVDRDGLLDAELLAALARRRLVLAVPGYAAETLVHALVPATHVDVTCPGGVMAICNALSGERLTHACFGPSAAWIPFERDALAQARRVAAASACGARLALLAKRGLVTWGETARDCHAATVAAADRADMFILSRSRGPRWGGSTLTPPEARRREVLLGRLLPVLRRELVGAGSSVLMADSSPEVLEFLCARDAPTLAEAGPAYPRQATLTRRLPLWIDCDPVRDDEADLAERIVKRLSRYRARARWETAVRGASGPALLDVDPRIVLIGATAMVAIAESVTAAGRALHAYRHAIEVMAGAAGVDRFTPLTALESGPFLPAPP
jgi:rhamnose utilization protein RhaD (predicted bifunctional aldolase and dehydrogenase)